MKITKGAFCRFTLPGRIKLLHQYGNFICSKIIDAKKIMVFKLCDFYVAVIKDLVRNCILEANPIISHELLQFFVSLNT